jgi:hypothetical protein
MKPRTLLVVLAAITAGVVVGAQAPLPTELVTAHRVYLSSDGVERQWLDKLAIEIGKAGRFRIVPAKSESDIIITITKGPGVGVSVPLGGAYVHTDNDVFHLTVTDTPTGAVLWDDTRETQWTRGGAITTLSKRLHDQIAKAAAK